MDKKEILDILDNAKDERGAVPMRLVRQAFDKLVQPEESTEKRAETRACDLVSRQAVIRWVKTECNPYGKPTLDFESGKRVIKHLEQMPSAQPEVIRCKDCKHLYEDNKCPLRTWWTHTEDDYCSYAERRSDE